MAALAMLCHVCDFTAALILFTRWGQQTLPENPGQTPCDRNWFLLLEAWWSKYENKDSFPTLLTVMPQQYQSSTSLACATLKCLILRTAMSCWFEFLFFSFKSLNRTGQMAQWVKALAAKPKDLSFDPRNKCCVPTHIHTPNLSFKH